MQERRDSDVMRRDEEYVGKRVMVMDLAGRRRKGRPKPRWMDRVNVNLREKGLSEEEMLNRAVQTHLPGIEVGKDAVK